MPELAFSDLLFAGIVWTPAMTQGAISLVGGLLGGGKGPDIKGAVKTAQAAQDGVIAANKAEQDAYIFDVGQEIASKFARFVDSDIGPAQIVSLKAIKSLDTAIANAKAAKAQLAVTEAQNKKQGGGGPLAFVGKALGFLGI
jgi:hypothetical protein